MDIEETIGIYSTSFKPRRVSEHMQMIAAEKSPPPTNSNTATTPAVSHEKNRAD